MTTGIDIVIEARKWIDTPFRHQGRVMGVGVDCIGLVTEVGRALGLTDADVSNYSRQPDPALMLTGLNTYMDHIPTASIQPGDVLWFALDTLPRHLAIVTDHGIIHAAAKLKRVCEHVLDDYWRSMIRGAWRFRGIE